MGSTCSSPTARQALAEARVVRSSPPPTPVEILGAHILGAEATELIAEFGLGRPSRPRSKWIHDPRPPTMAEAVMEAALDAMGQAIHL
jgi:hypothetical protein